MRPAFSQPVRHNPPTVPASIASMDAWQLIEFMKSTDAQRAKLEEIKTAEQAVAASLAELNAAEKKFREELAVAEKAIAEAQSSNEGERNVIRGLKGTIDRDRENLDAKAQSLKDRTARIDERELLTERAEASLNARAKALDDRETAIAAGEESLAKRKAAIDEIAQVVARASSRTS